MLITTTRSDHLCGMKKISVLCILIFTLIFPAGGCFDLKEAYTLADATSLICLRFTPFAVLVMLLVFLAIIPICVYLGKLTAPFRGKESFEKKEVKFIIRNGSLYTGDIRLDVEWDKTDHSILVDNAYLYKPFKHQKGTVVTKFAGIIEEPFADDFMGFLRENNVEGIRNVV